MDTLSFIVLTVYWALVCSVWGRIIIFSMQYGHRLSFIKEMLAKSEYEKMKGDGSGMYFYWLRGLVASKYTIHEDAIAIMDERYEMLSHKNKLIGLFSCVYCLSTFLSCMTALCVWAWTIMNYQGGIFLGFILFITIPAFTFLLTMLISRL